MGGHRPHRIAGEHETWLLQRVENDADVTLRGLEGELGGRGLAVDHATVGRFLHRKGQSFKKNRVRAERKRPALARFRARWQAYQGRIDPRRLVFLDETWIETNMAPLRGWGPRCKRLLAHVPYKRWKTMTFIAALRHDRIEAPSNTACRV